MPRQSTCECGNAKNVNARQCQSCANESRRQALTGVKHTAERRRHNSEARKALHASGWRNLKQIAAVTGKPSWRRMPVGSTRVENGHIKIKCADGKWRYRARVMWEEAFGSLTSHDLIHHINEDPFDDRLENFQLVTRAEHARIHAIEDDRAAKMRAGRIVQRAARGLTTKAS